MYLLVYTLNAFVFYGGTWALQDTTNQITALHGIITTDSPAATTTSSPREVSWFAPPDNAFKLNVAGAHWPVTQDLQAFGAFSGIILLNG